MYAGRPGERPGDWLGYAPGTSPFRERGGPMSPKKKTMNWRVAQDLAKEREQTKEHEPSSRPSAPAPIPVIKSIPDIDKPSLETTQQESSESSEEEVEVTHEVVEVEVEEEEDEEEDEEEVVEYEDDESSEYEEEVVEVEDSDSEDFEPLPPPIVIPNALKPPHLRTPEVRPKKKVVLDDSSDSSDSSCSSDSSKEAIKQVPKPNLSSSPRPGVARGRDVDIKASSSAKHGEKKSEKANSDDEEDSSDSEEPPFNPCGLRPGAVRGHSFDHGIQDMSSAVRKGKKPDTPVSSNSVDDSEEKVKEAPRVSPGRSLRPGVVRGHSCDDDVQAMSSAARGGKRPEKESAKEDVDNHKEENAVAIDDIKEAPRVSPGRSLRPGVVRGHSCDDDVQAMSSAARGGKKPEKESAKEDVDSHKEENTVAIDDIKEAPRVSPGRSLRPGVVRGHSCDDDVQAMSSAARGGKRPAKESAKEDVDKEENAVAIDDVKEAPRVSPGRSLRPAAVRGYSCDDDIKVMNTVVRGGKRSDNGQDEKPTAAVSQSHDNVKETDNTKKTGYRNLRDQQPASPPRKEAETARAYNPTTPSKPSKPNYRSMRDNAPSSPSTKPSYRASRETDRAPASPPKPSYQAQRHDAVPASPSVKPSYRTQRDTAPTTPKTPKTASYKPNSPSKAVRGEDMPPAPLRTAASPSKGYSPTKSLRGEDTPPPVPGQTHVDENSAEQKGLWEKPSWATKRVLRTTDKGEKLKQGSEIAKPIGGIKHID